MEARGREGRIGEARSKLGTQMIAVLIKLDIRGFEMHNFQELSTRLADKLFPPFIIATYRAAPQHLSWKTKRKEKDGSRDKQINISATGTADEFCCFFFLCLAGIYSS